MKVGFLMKPANERTQDFSSGMMRVNVFLRAVQISFVPLIGVCVRRIS